MPVDLYLAKPDEGVKKLNELANERVKIDKPAKEIATWVEKLWEASEKSRLDQDEEKEYIFKFALLETLVNFRQSASYKNNKKILDGKTFMKRLVPALERTELLKQILESRYSGFIEDKIRFESIKEEKERKEREAQKALQERLSQKVDEIINKSPTGIQPKELVELVKDHGEKMYEAGGIMILDIRSREAFNRNRIAFLPKWPYHPALIHVPIHNVSADQCIGPQLTKDSLKIPNYPFQFENRHQCRLIVLLSEKSSTTDLLVKQNPVLNTFKALTEFDSPKQISKERIRVLDGGLYEWRSLYNFMMSDPTEEVPKANFRESDILRSADEVNYDSVAEILDPKPKPRPKPQVQEPTIKPEKSEPIIKENTTTPIPKVLEHNPDLKEKLDRLALLEAEEVKRRRTPLREAPEVPSKQTKTKEEEEIEKLRSQIAALEAKNRAHEVGDLRKKKASHPASKKTASTKNTPPERPTAPKPSKNKEPAPEVITKPVAQQQPKRDSLEEKVTKQVDLTLPDDIERKYDSKTNRFYYLNHKDKTTSWSPPDGAEIDRAVKPARKSIKQINDFELLMPVHGSIERGYTGLKNLGNTCYMNSIIQSLGSLAPLVDKFLTDKYRADINKKNFLGHKGLVAEHFAVVAKGLWHGGFKNFQPRMFKEALASCNPIFGNYKQQDAQELLIFLLDGLHEDLNKVKDRRYIEEKDADGRPDQLVADESWENHTRLNRSIIVDLFQGQFKATIKCLSCKFTSVKFDAFMFLSLPIPTSGKATLEGCLNLFQQTEKLTGEDRWTCPKCMRPRDAERTLRLWRMPTLLIIHLKRFKSDGRWKSKVSTNISYPTAGFDLKPQTLGKKKQPPYNLIAVTHHIGASTDSGHYVASCRRAKGWVKADDAEVTKISESKAISPTAYILFYSSKPYDSDPSGGVQF